MFRLLTPLYRRQLDVRNKTVLITGASSGVGRALAFRFHRAGAKLILTARSVDKLEQLCTELKAVSLALNGIVILVRTRLERILILLFLTYSSYSR